MRSIMKIGSQRLPSTSTARLPETVRKLIAPGSKPHQLTPPEFAFAHRIGMQSLALTIFRQALAHPLLSSDPAQSNSHNDLASLGRSVLELFVQEYVACRFPKLPSYMSRLARQVYLDDRNLSSVMRSVGVDSLLVPLQGIPAIKLPSLNTHLQSKTEKGNNPPDLHAFCSSLFHALVGACFQDKGAGEVRRFLDSYLFSCQLDTDSLCRPKNPSLTLARAMISHKRSEPDYRLLHETGRQSNTSLYVVGVYSGVDKLAEDSAPSMLMAQNRAALAALKKMYLVEMPNPPRPSDRLYLQQSTILKVDDLKTFLHPPIKE